MAKQFKCTNYNVCPEADKETVFQEMDLEEVDGKYVCPNCGQKLEVINNDGCGGKGKLIAVIAASAIVICAGAFFLLKDKGRKKPSVIPVESITLDQTNFTMHETDPFAILATVSPEGATDRSVTWSVSDSCVLQNNGDGSFVCLNAGEVDITAQAGDATASCHLTVLPIDSGETPNEPEEPIEPKQGPYSLGWGTYTGPMQGGKPHGLGGEVKVTRSYKLDLKKGDGSACSLSKGDRIVDCKFKDGKLVSGYIHYADGRQEHIRIGA